MKIWLISDTHCQHLSLDAPDVDMVIHCGDEANSRDVAVNANESRVFFEWFGALPIEHKIFVPGNHSVAFSHGIIDRHPDVTYLIHSSTEIEGLKIFGSPYTPAFGVSWAYMRPRPKMDKVWNTIDEEVDILITHGPPKGMLDMTTDIDRGHPLNVGCKNLLRAVHRIKPRLHAFGHIHEEGDFANSGIKVSGSLPKTTFMNCSVVDRRGNLHSNGFVVNI